MQRHMSKLGLEERTGRHGLTPEFEVDGETLRNAGKLLASVLLAAAVTERQPRPGLLGDRWGARGLVWKEGPWCGLLLE